MCRKPAFIRLLAELFLFAGLFLSVFFCVASPGEGTSADAPPAPASLEDILMKQAAAAVGLPAPTKTGAADNETPLFLLDDPDRLYRSSISRNGRSAAPRSGTLESDDFLSHGLSWMSGLANSSAESLLTGPVEGAQARVNFLLDGDGRLNGEADVLFPLYDGIHTTLFTQMGARTMSVNGGEASGQLRWIGNFGLGQRWYPLALDETDAGNWMLGYNVFLDNDFTRSHQRGGVGLEAQADWLKLSSNYYWPLSGWKDSPDFDGHFIEERAARGWDARVKAWLPSYRNIALTGSYARWYGDHVGLYSLDSLENNPRIWSYGVEYTPVPQLTAFFRQQNSEQGKTHAEFGLNFTYRFDLSAKEHVSHAKVRELRTVSGSRHDFVDRENKIILEYRARQDYRIGLLRRTGDNEFRFRVTKAFAGYAAGMNVTVSTGGAWLAQSVPLPPDGFLARAAAALNDLISVRSAYAGVLSKQYVTDGRGEFLLRLDPDTLPPDGRVSVIVQVENTEAEFTLQGTPASYTLEMTAATLPLAQGTPADVTFTVKQDGQAVTSSKSLTFAANANFPALPSGAQTTSASGTLTVNNLTALAAGAQTIKATVNEQAVSVEFTVTAAAYSLAMSPTTLVQGTAASVTFTLTQGGTPVSGKSVSFASGAGNNDDFLNLTAQTTLANGTFSLTGLTAKNS
ncbi:MAG: inverse autotransporter beta domain-containing protein, partial [Deltaproteobacteria bacterium]|nr:inverse autotransporter beta domain-containing protein [Deltaproteobacteria bacterium]